MRKMQWTVLVFLNVLLPSLIFSQGRTINGRVTDAKSTPVPGVNVMVRQTNKGTTTDVDGKFSFVVPENATLTVSSSGFQSQTINVGPSQIDVQVKLEE